MTLYDALKKEILLHPLSEPDDVVKFIYQNEFGGGHLIKSRDDCLERIRNEIDIASCYDDSIYNDIGNGIVRLNLANAVKSGLTAVQINNIFINSSEEITGNTDSLMSKTEVILESFENLKFKFSRDDFMLFWDNYSKSGFPVISHSDIYRINYKPCYRVVLKKLIPNC